MTVADRVHAAAAALHHRVHGKPWEQHIAEALAVVSTPLAEHTTRAIGRLLPADLHDVEDGDD